MKQDKDPDQGDRASARRYDRYIREYIADGRVRDAARDRDPDDARKSERAASRGPGKRSVSVDELVAKGHSIVDRVKRTMDSLRSRFGHN